MIYDRRIILIINIQYSYRGKSCTKVYDNLISRYPIINDGRDPIVYSCMYERNHFGSYRVLANFQHAHVRVNLSDYSIVVYEPLAY